MTFWRLICHLLWALMLLGCQEEPGDVPGQRPADEEDGTGISGPVPARLHVEALRGRLARAQQEYAASLAVAGLDASPGSARLPGESTALPTEPKPLAADQVGKLRLALGEQVAATVRDGTSSEVRLAVHRATVETLLDTIRAYEHRYGRGSGAATTEWNVLSTEELTTLRDRARQDLVTLYQEEARYSPPERPAELSGRIRELQGWSEALDAEIEARGGRSPPALKEIRPGVTVAQARGTSPTIAGLDDFFEPGSSREWLRRLRVQTEIRSQWAGGDETLALLRKDLARGVSPGKILGQSGGPERGGPSLGSPGPGNRGPPWGPRPGPGETSAGELWVAALQEATRAELKATRSADLPALARARARQTIAELWLNLAADSKASSPGAGLTVQPDESLLKLRQAYRSLRVELERAHARSPSPALDLRISETGDSQAAIDRELFTRHLPSPDSRRGPLRLTHSPELAAFERNLSAHWARQEALQAQKLLDRPTLIPDQNLASLREAATTRERLGRADALDRAWDDCLDLQRRVLRDGRGVEGAETGRELLAVQRQLGGAASSLRSELGAEPPGREPAAARLAEWSARWRNRPGDALRPSDDPLLSLERARARWGGAGRAAMSVEVVEPGLVNRSADTSRRLSLAPARRVPASLSERLPEPRGFDALFPDSEQWTKTRKGLLDVERLRRAPGGIVIDGVLPEAVAERLQGARVDAAGVRLKVKIDGVWKTVTPRPERGWLRSAWAFASDGRLAAVDLRNLDAGETEYLIYTLAPAPPHLLAPSDKEDLRRILGSFTSVNLHPALVHTTIGADLIASDQVVFDILPSQAVRTEQVPATVVDLRRLRTLFREDRREEVASPGYGTGLFRKSIVSVTGLLAAIGGDSLTVRSRFEFEVYQVPVEGLSIPPFLYRGTSGWFDANQGMLLTKYRSLHDIARFGTLVGVLRAVLAKGVPHNFDRLLETEVTYFETPRYLCRGSNCDWNQLTETLDLREAGRGSKEVRHDRRE